MREFISEFPNCLSVAWRSMGGGDRLDWRNSARRWRWRPLAVGGSVAWFLRGRRCVHDQDHRQTMSRHRVAWLTFADGLLSTIVRRAPHHTNMERLLYRACAPKLQRPGSSAASFGNWKKSPAGVSVDLRVGQSYQRKAPSAHSHRHSGVGLGVCACLHVFGHRGCPSPRLFLRAHQC